MVKSAELTLVGAKSRREKLLQAADMKIASAHSIQSNVRQSTSNQLEKTVLEQDSRIAKLESDVASADVRISTQEKAILNARKTTDASVAFESEKLRLRETAVKTAISNAHSTVFRIFY